MGKQVNTGLACLAVGWGWGVADVRGALVSESTWSHFCPVSWIYIVLGARIATAGSSNGRLTVGFCYATVVGLPLVAVLWPHGAGVPLAYGGWSGDSQRSDSVQLGSGCA